MRQTDGSYRQLADLHLRTRMKHRVESVWVFFGPAPREEDVSGVLDCAQYYCSVSRAIGIDYNSQGDAMIKCDSL